ncbi:MAG: hypothetical protein IKN49_05000 [Elusimicrobiaceae bacterium]|nr:hypothetical protein [Elusimicrobiaceae bacterium]
MRYLLVLIGSGLLISGCFSLTDKKPSVTPVMDSPLQIAAAPAKPVKKTTSQTLPKTLGGVLQSDSWIVYQEKQEEEFKGNVSYQSDVYQFKADYALSQRAQNLFTAKGNVFLHKKDPDGSWYELHADQAVYNYKTGKGYAISSSTKPVQLVYHTRQGDTIRAHANRADFDTQNKIYQLMGSAVIVRTDPQGEKTTLKARKILAKQATQYALLQGNAQAFNDQYRLQADQIEYDGQTQTATASGQRALANGTTENGTFAIIADEVIAQTDTRRIHLEGNVQGWLLSDQLNELEKNKGRK